MCVCVCVRNSARTHTNTIIYYIRTPVIPFRVKPRVMPIYTFIITTALVLRIRVKRYPFDIYYK